MKICLLVVILAATLAAQTLPPDTVVAKIDGKNITAADVQKILDNTPEFLGPFKRNPTQALGEYFMLKQLAVEGEKEKLDQMSPWKEQLASRREQIMANAMVNHERDAYPVSAEMMEAYYKAHSDRYQQAKIKVILISFKPAPPTGTSPEAVKAAAEALLRPPDPNKRTEEQAKAFATDLVKQIRNGADFVKMVAEHSDDDVSKPAGGDFGVIKAGSSYPEELKKAVFALKQGDVSDPVRQPTGFYIIRCEEKTVQAIDEVREPIVQDIRQQHMSEYLNDLNRRFAPKVEKPEFFQQAH